jgi:hypothetical protein
MIVIGYVAAIGAIIFIAIALFASIGVLSFLPGTMTTTGAITHCTMVQVPQTGSNGHPDGTTEDCQPTVSFRTQSGQQITFTSSWGSNYQVGDLLSVRYHPDNPQGARVDDFGSTWLLPVVLSVMFFGWLLIGQVFLRVGKRRRKAEELSLATS